MPAAEDRPAVSAVLDELCDRFEAALRHAERPRIEGWLSEAGSEAGALLPELVAVELDHRIRAGEPATAAEYFARFPNLLSDPAVAVRLVAVEFRAAKVGRPDLTEADFRSRYRDLVDHPDWSDGPWASPPAGRTWSEAAGPDETGPFHPAETRPTGFLLELLAPADAPGFMGRLGDYHVRGVLGAGGMGVVLGAEDPTLRRPVAIKVMRPEVAVRPGARERFLREARSAAAVEHPRVVAIHHVGEWGGTPFLVMPLMAGRSLAARLANGPPVPLADAVRFTREAADGLSAAHAKGLIHRDIKPDNIWLEETAEGTHVRLLDFGLAHDDAAEPMTQPGTVLGTPAGMAPEQAAGQPVSPRADLFSLGCVLYELLTRKKPFAGPTVMAVLSALATYTPPPPTESNPSVPAPLSALTMQLLEKPPDRRPVSAADVSIALRGIETLLAAGGRVGGLPRPIPPRPRPPRWAWPVAAVLLIGIASTAGWMITRDRTPEVASVPPTVPAAITPSPAGAIPTLFRVTTIRVNHLTRVPAGHAFSGVLGEGSFTPAPEDRVTIEARLSQPGYAYLIAYRPDGKAELCFPKDEDTPPPLTEAPRYPAAGVLNKAYGLEEGPGLWVFAVVASERPLPSYNTFLSQLGDAPVWEPQRETPSGVVWWDDGFSTLDHITVNGVLHLQRGKDAELQGPSVTIKRLTDALRTRGMVDAASAFGFGVARK